MIISPVMWLSQWLLFHQLCDSPSDGYFTSYVTLNPWVNIILGCVVASPYSLWQERRFQFSHFELSIYNKHHTSSTCIWSTHFSVHSIFLSLCFHLESFWKGLMPTGKLQTQGFLVIKLQLLPRKFYGRHLDFTYYYGMSVSHITTDMFRSPFSNPFFSCFMTYHRIFNMSKTTDATSGAGTGHSFGTSDLTPGF